MMGVMPVARALAIARERDLDLVEVSPNAIPPVCKLLNYGRYKYQQAKKENETRKNQKTVTLKEIRLRPRTDDHDIQVKVRKIIEFLTEGDKVRVSVQFRGPDMRHPEIGRKLLDGIVEDLKGIAVIERPPLMEGRVMSMMVARAPGWEPPKKQSTSSAAASAKESPKTSPTQSDDSDDVEQAANPAFDAASAEFAPVPGTPSAVPSATDPEELNPQNVSPEHNGHNGNGAQETRTSADSPPLTHLEGTAKS
jgi:translation initiation factor IF-3